MTVQSKFAKVLGSKMHYVSEGEGKPIVFLHGSPVSSYVWRNIIPKVALGAQCIAPDFIGMGESDKPDIDYTIEDHIKYFDTFMNELKLSDVTLVMQGMGSIVGMSYAQKNAKNISGLVFIESFLHVPATVAEIPMLIQEVVPPKHNHEKLKQMVIEENYLLKRFLPGLTLKKLSPEMLEVYAKPYPDEKSREVLWQSLYENPFFNPQSPVIPMINEYLEWLTKSQIKKLLLYAIPGFIVSMDTVKWCADHFPNITTVDLGFGLHYLPETLPSEISSAIVKWVSSK